MLFIFGYIILGIIILYVVSELIEAIDQISKDNQSTNSNKTPPNITQHNYDECFKNDLMTDDDIHNRF